MSTFNSLLRDQNQNSKRIFHLYKDSFNSLLRDQGSGSTERPTHILLSILSCEISVDGSHALMVQTIFTFNSLLRDQFAIHGHYAGTRVGLSILSCEIRSERYCRYDPDGISFNSLLRDQS